MRKIVFVVVNYRNSRETVDFCKSVSNIKSAVVVVADNSGEIKREILLDNTVLVRSPRNLGYLNGCAYGFKKWLEMGNGLPKFVCVCNTDIVFLDGLDRLIGLKTYEKNVGCVAPKVTLRNGHNQSLHAINRASLKQINFLYAIHRFSTVGAAYMLMSRIKLALRPKKSTSNATMEIYSPHGSCFFVTRRFFEKGGSLSYGGFLHDEECHIGEQVRRCGLYTVFDPSIKVLHLAHSSLGLIGLKKQSSFHRQSLNWIKAKYFSSEESMATKA